METLKKSKAVEDLLETMTNRKEAIFMYTCVKRPIGCGMPAIEFKDDISRKEFTISGLCQKCQDEIFNC